MRHKIQYKQGDKIGNCTFIEELPTVLVGKSKTVRRYMLFKCICGKEFRAIYLAIKNGTTQSCGCIRDYKIQQQGHKNKTHGQRYNPLYKTWSGIMQRCNNPKTSSYHNYGGRGIKVCERWTNITNFIEDMYPTYKKGLDIDRINNNGNYEPSNCRWITRKQNTNNMRKNRIIEYDHMKKTVSEWSDYLNIPYKVLISRLNKWSISDSFTTPYPTRNNNNKINSRYVEYNGVKQTITQWCVELGISYSAMKFRLANWNLDDVFNVPYPTHGGPYKNRKVK